MAEVRRLGPAVLCSLPPASCFRPTVPHLSILQVSAVASVPHYNAAAKPVTVPQRAKTRLTLVFHPVTLKASLSSRAGTTPFADTENDESGEESSVRKKDSEFKKDAGTMSFDEWIKKNAQTTGPSRVPGSKTSKVLAKQVQDFINEDLEKRHKSDNESGGSEGDDFALYVDEDDPYWLDEPDEGWGFRISDLFTEKFEIKKTNNKDDDEPDDLHIEWDLQPETWSATDVDSMNWRATAFDDPSPLVVLLYERYGNRGRLCYHVLRELEDAANHIWESNRLPPRLARINVSLEVDLARALRVKEVPTFLFIKAGKLLHQQSGYLTADNLKRMIGYFYHGAARPACLKKSHVAEEFSSTQ